MKMARCVALGAFVAGCHESPTGVAGPNCADVGIPAITVIALDYVSRQPIRSNGLAIARDGLYADTIRAGESNSLYPLAYNRPGTYSVTVELAGYQPWRVDGIVVHLGRCNVATVPLAAMLLPTTTAIVSPTNAEAE